MASFNQLAQRMEDGEMRGGENEIKTDVDIRRRYSAIEEDVLVIFWLYKVRLL